MSNAGMESNTGSLGGVSRSPRGLGILLFAVVVSVNSVLFASPMVGILSIMIALIGLIDLLDG